MHSRNGRNKTSGMRFCDSTSVGQHGSVLLRTSTTKVASEARDQTRWPDLSISPALAGRTSFLQGAKGRSRLQPSRGWKVHPPNDFIGRCCQDSTLLDDERYNFRILHADASVTDSNVALSNAFCASKIHLTGLHSLRLGRSCRNQGNKWWTDITTDVRSAPRRREGTYQRWKIVR